MKKIISIGLGFLIILNTFGFNLILIYLLHENKTESFEFIERHSASIPAERIVTISLLKDNPSFLNPREIYLNEKMYDIVSFVNSGEDILYYCISDKIDTKLQASFCSLNKIKDNPVSASGHLTLDILKNLLKIYLPYNELQTQNNIQDQQFTDADSLSLPLIILDKIFPPPEFRS